MKETYKRYSEHKKNHKDCIILMRCGDFYETYDEDAKTTAFVCGIILNKSNGIKYAGFPHYALDTYLPKLIRAGHRIAFAD